MSLQGQDWARLIEEAEELAARRGHTKTSLAKMLGVATLTVRRWKAREREPKGKNRLQLLSVLRELRVGIESEIATGGPPGTGEIAALRREMMGRFTQIEARLRQIESTALRVVPAETSLAEAAGQDEKATRKVKREHRR